MMLKAIASWSGMATAVSSRLCPSSLRLRKNKRRHIVFIPYCTRASPRSNVRVSPTVVAVESSMPGGSSSTAAAFQKRRVMRKVRMRRRSANTFHPPSSTTTSIGNSMPQVCTPCDGTISSPSPGGSSRSPSRPTIRDNPVSATRTRSPRTVPRVALTTRTIFLCHLIVLLGQVLEHLLQADNRRPQSDNKNAGKNKQHQGKEQLHTRLCSSFFGRLRTAYAERVCKDSQCVRDRRAKALSLY